MDDFSFFQPSAMPYPAATARRSRTADKILTSILLVIYVGGFLLIAFISLAGLMVTDSCGYNHCSYGNLTTGYVLIDAVGGIVMLGISITAVAFMIRNRVAFWLPLAGIATQLVLIVSAWHFFTNVVS